MPGKKFIRHAVIAIAALLLAAISTAAALFGPYYLNVQAFEARPESGYHADFFLYVSPGAREAAAAGKSVHILVQPNNSGRTSDDPEVHRADAKWTGLERHGIADELGVVLLVPAFIRPATDWQVYTHALDRDVFTTSRPELYRPDLQLLAMLEHAREALQREGIETEERILMMGYSASGMFANRFAILHPGKLLAVAAGSPGGWPTAPVRDINGETLPWPLGIGDLEQLSGSQFDADAFMKLPQLIYMGSADDNDSVDFRDGYEEESAALADRLFGETPLARWEISEKLYKDATARTRFRLVDGVAHERRQLQPLAVEFLQDVLAETAPSQ